MKPLLSVVEIIRDPQAYIGREAMVQGWVRTSRDVKACAFVELNDGSTIKNIQIVVDNTNPNYKNAASLNVGSAITVCGVLEKSPGDTQPVELRCESFVIDGECPPEYPLQKKRHTIEYLRTIQHLRPRTNLFSAAFRVRSAAAFGLHKFFNENGFIYAHTPIITASDAEGAGAMFQVTTLDLNNVPRTETGEPDYERDFFGSSANLTVSGQLEAEIFALAFKKTYTFGPTFRAEHSNTPRHAAEFWMIEPEIAFAGLDELIELAEAMTKSVIKYVLDTCREELEFLNSFVDKGLLDRLRASAFEESFGRVTYTEAIEILQKNASNFEFQVHWGSDIQTEHEKYLAEVVFKKPVFVTDYPREIKSFYMRRNDDGKTVAATDMLVPGIGELIGGSQREEREDVLKQALADFKLDEKLYWWYLELRKYGGVRHAGYGIGFERFVMYLTGISNIRDVLPFPRTVGSADF